MMNRNARQGIVCAILLAMGISASVHAQTLTVTNNLRLWLKADSLTGLNNGDPVTAWNDSSTNAWNASQPSVPAQPTYLASFRNGKPAVHFVNLEFLQSATSQTSSSTPMMFVVYRATARFGDGGVFDLGNNASTFAGLAFRGTGGTLKTEACNFGCTGSTMTDVTTDGVTRIVTGSFSGGPGPNPQTANSWVNGRSDDSLQTFADSSSTHINYRVSDLFGFGGIAGDIAEVVVYDTNLASTDRQNVVEYLVGKYAIPEPSSIGLMVVGALVFWKRRIRRT